MVVVVVVVVVVVGGSGRGVRVPSINKYNPLKLGFHMDVCLTVVEEMPVVDMPTASH